jgi:hypothetical protein
VKARPLPLGVEREGAKGSKHLRSSHDDESPTKHRRTGGDATAKDPSMLAEKDVLHHPLPNLFVRVLQENWIRCCGGEKDDETEIEIDVHALGDEALRAIKNRIGAYLHGIARRDAAWSQRKKWSGRARQEASQRTDSHPKLQWRASR